MTCLSGLVSSGLASIPSCFSPSLAWVAERCWVRGLTEQMGTWGAKVSLAKVTNVFPGVFCCLRGKLIPRHCLAPLTFGLKPSWVCFPCHATVGYFPHFKSEIHSMHCVCSMALFPFPFSHMPYLLRCLYSNTHHQSSKALQLPSISASTSSQPYIPALLPWVFISG